jgi:hypothetical protein
MSHTAEVLCPATTMKEIYAGLHAYFQRWIDDESADYKPTVTMQFETRLIGVAPNDVHGAFWELSQQGILYASQFIAEQQANERWKGYYVTVNPAPLTDVIKGKLLKKLTNDAEVKYCFWILIDIDPIRTDAACETWNTTEEETGNAVAVSEWCKWMLATGLPGIAPTIENRTGNGVCLMYPVERLTAQEHKQILSWIANQYAESIGAAAPTVKFDTKVCNPSRVWRIPGTVGRKPGDDLTRPKVKKCITTTCVKLRADEYTTIAINNMGGAYRITGNVENGIGVKSKPFKPTDKPKPQARTLPKVERPELLKTRTELPNREWFSRGITYVTKMAESDRNPDYFQRAKWYVETLAAQAPALSGNGGHDRTFAAVVKIVQIFDMLQPQQHWDLIKQYNETGTGDEKWTEKELLHKYNDAIKAPQNQHVSASVTDATTEEKNRKLAKAVKKISDIFDMLDIDDQIYLVCLYSRVAFRDVCNEEAYQLLGDADGKPRLHESMTTRPPAPSSLRFKFTIENLGGQR